MGILSSYSFAQCVFMLGPLQIEDFYKGDDCVTVERRADEFDIEVGADRGGIITVNPDTSANVTLKLMQNGRGNAILSTRLKAQQSGIFPLDGFAVIDRNSADVVFGGQAVIMGPPAYVRGVASNASEWKLVTFEQEINIFGTAI